MQISFLNSAQKQNHKKTNKTIGIKSGNSKHSYIELFSISGVINRLSKISSEQEFTHFVHEKFQNIYYLIFRKIVKKNYEQLNIVGCFFFLCWIRMLFVTKTTLRAFLVFHASSVEAIPTDVPQMKEEQITASTAF